MAERAGSKHIALVAITAAFVFIVAVTAFAGEQQQEISMSNHPYVGLWITKDEHIRHELLANGRYIEARGNRERAYTGEYRVNGNHIDYKDDTGFLADGEFRKDVLYHAGMMLVRG
ncbi:MAG: Atu4866 domain-containing protein [Pseudorhizobium pelagicum]|uniref:Atu4866 domain-containing protein n=1 Tax=Pseudorhizobium pelagicum TaxID=1509405 RepID=UPI0034604E06